MKVTKKPVIVDAWPWSKDGDHPNVHKYVGSNHANSKCPHCNLLYRQHGLIETLEGSSIICPGDWVIKGVHNEFYAIKPDIFKKTYDLIVTDQKDSSSTLMMTSSKTPYWKWGIGALIAYAFGFLTGLPL